MVELRICAPESAGTGKESLLINPLNNMTIVQSSQNDVFTSPLSAKALVTLTPGAGNDTIAISSQPSNLSVNLDGTLKTALVVTDFTHGSDHLDVTALTAANYIGISGPQQGAISSAATFAAAATLALNDVGNANGKFTAFIYGAVGAEDTYLITSDATAGISAGDGLVKLIGLHTFTVGATGIGTADIFIS